MAHSQQSQESRVNSEHTWEDGIRHEISYYSGCLDEIRGSNDPEYKALFPIYESLLAHRQRQLQKLVASQAA